jgi:hypothetical protein
MAAFSSQAVTRFVLNPAQQPDDGQQHHDDRGHVAHKDRGDHGYDLGSQPGPSINFPFVCLAADNSEASSMDPRKRQTATATPSEPGGFPLGAHTVDLCRLCYGLPRLATLHEPALGIDAHVRLHTKIPLVSRGQCHFIWVASPSFEKYSAKNNAGCRHPNCSDRCHQIGGRTAAAYPMTWSPTCSSIRAPRAEAWHPVCHVGRSENGTADGFLQWLVVR